jgi:tetratricopeptide (TPR) repeat protein
MARVAIAWAAAAAVCTVAPARADDILTRTIPGKWVEPMIPENDPEPYYPEYDADNPLAKAKIQVNAGQYRRALATLAKADVAPKSKPEAALIKAEALAALGREPEALDLLAQPEFASELKLQILRADLLGQLEQYPAALAMLNQLVAAHPTSIAAHYYLGLYSEKSGDYDAATKAYQWFNDPPQSYVDRWRNNPHSFNDAEEVVLIGKALDRWATLTGAYQQDLGLHNQFLSMFTAAYNRIDAEYFPAHTAAAAYFVAHDDPDHAAEELNEALTGNPHDLAAHALAGKIAVDGFNFAATEQQIAAIRDVNSDSIDAELLDARDLLQQRRPEEAVAPLTSVLARRPNNIEALGLLAAAQAATLDETAMTATLKRADAIQPKSPVAYFELAEQLGGLRQYDRSAAMYKVALARAPWWPDVRNGLGLLMTQSGEEDLARVVLEAAHAVDPFNVRAVNYLKLLDQMDKFTKKESAHFIVMYDATEDPVIPEYFSDYLESVYPIVTGDFKYEPKVKTLIEVFPTHEAFSVRTVGSPWISTVGASTGRVIALAAPRDGAGGAFNWSRVVRHEFTHTVTLGATENRIALWFTEGLAVWEEHSPLQWEWVPMLQDAVQNDKLFPIENLTWAFVRPKGPNDRQLGYAESVWICTYIEQTYGHQAILTMLDETRKGHDVDAMFQAGVHKSADAFFVEFKAWAKKQVDGWGYDEISSAKYEVLVGEADELIKTQEYTGAAKLWEQVVKLRPMDLLPHERLMGIYLQLKDSEKAEDQLDILSKVELKDNRYAKVLARLYERTGKLDLASQRALQAVYINPYDMAAHELLEDVATKAAAGATDDADKAKYTALADRENRVMPILNQWLSEAHDTGDSSPAPAPTAQ